MSSLSLHNHLSPNIQNYSLSSPLSSFQAAAAYQMLGSTNNERSYLIENLQRQHGRGQRLSHALSNIEIRLASSQSKAESRKLRKEAGLLKSKIAESNKQERLIAMRLNDMQNEDSNRLCHAQQLGLLPYPYSSLQPPWGQMTLSPMTPLTPVSPLSPLPPGLYHPAPILPSPLEAPLFLTSSVLLYSPVVPFEQNYFIAGDHQGSYAPEQHDAVSSIETDGARKSVEHTAARGFESVLSGQDRMGRRWSLADTFSPSPRDKRMSMPGLQTIWRY